MPDRSEDAFALIEADAPSGIVARDAELVLAGGPVQHAVDPQGRRHLLVPLGDGQAAAEDHRSRGVTIHTHELVDREIVTRYIDVACEIPALRDLFSVICDDMLERIAMDPSTPGRACSSVLDRWRDLIREPSEQLLSRQALSGLLAELHVLESLAAQDPSAALRVWTGPTKGRADFTGGKTALEVKATTARERVTVEIHGVKQLQAGEGTELFLRVERQEQVPIDGDSVPDAVVRLLDAGVDAATLERGLQAVGYSSVDAAAYSLVRFRSEGERYYAINDDFPCITPLSFVRPSVLDRVTQLRYVLDLTVQPPIPLAGNAVGALLRNLLEAAPPW